MADGVSVYDYRMLFDEIAGQCTLISTQQAKVQQILWKYQQLGSLGELGMRRTTLPTLSHYCQIYFQSFFKSRPLFILNAG